MYSLYNMENIVNICNNRSDLQQIYKDKTETFKKEIISENQIIKSPEVKEVAQTNIDL